MIDRLSTRRKCGDPRLIARRFPPITDEEFLALCSPGTDQAIALRVRKVISEHLNVPYECIHPTARFVEDLGAD